MIPPREEQDREADPHDRATAAEDVRRRAAASMRKPEGPTPNGRCHYCDEVVGDEMRWCDVACRDAWEKEQR